MPEFTRRDCLGSLAAGAGGLFLATRGLAAPSGKEKRPLTSQGRGDVTTPRFFRHDVGTAPSRLHEPSVGPDGNMWTSPLDGSLWRYHCPSGDVEKIDLEALTGDPGVACTCGRWPTASKSCSAPRVYRGFGSGIVIIPLPQCAFMRRGHTGESLSYILRFPFSPSPPPLTMYTTYPKGN